MSVLICFLLLLGAEAFLCPQTTRNADLSATVTDEACEKEKTVVVIGAGWGGLSCANALASSGRDIAITVVDAAPRVGGLVRDGFESINGTRAAEAGQHGFWDSYYNIFRLLEELPTISSIDDVLTGYAEQGQYSPRGLEAVWPVYRDSNPQLPTGLAQAFYTRFLNLSPLDRMTAIPLVLAFSEFDDSKEAWEKFDLVSFRDLCVKLGVSRKMYVEAFESMILTGLFAPGAECSAAAALGMAYFFVLSSQNAFDVRWCKGNVGEKIFDPWVEHLQSLGVEFQLSTRVKGFRTDDSKITAIDCSVQDEDGAHELAIFADEVVFAVGGAALRNFVTFSPQLSKYSEFRKFSNLRGLSVLATRLYLDTVLDTPYSANACWGFDDGVGMTMFDITKLHELEGEMSIIELDYYHASPLLLMSDKDIVDKAKRDLDTILGEMARRAKVTDAAVVRLPNAVNWYSPGSYANMPDIKSSSLHNVYFAGDICRSRHGSWSQEKAFVTGIEAANEILGRPEGTGIIKLKPDEAHVSFGRDGLLAAKTVLGLGDANRAPSLVDFLAI